MAFHVAVGQDVLWFQAGFPWQLSPCWIHREHPCGSEDETSPSPPVLLFLKQVFGLVFSRVSVSCGSGNSLLTDLASKHRNESSHNSRGQKFKVRIAGLESGCHRSVLLRRLRGESVLCRLQVLGCQHAFDCGHVTPVSASHVSLPPPPSIVSSTSPASEILKVSLNLV